MDLLRVKRDSRMLVAVLFVFCMVHLSQSQRKCQPPPSKQFVFEGALGCDDLKLHIRCKQPKTVIVIYTAKYGRPRGVSSGICYNEAKNMTVCDAVDIKDVLAMKCNNRRHCGFKVHPSTLQVKDTCPTVFKYVNVMYMCWKGKKRRRNPKHQTDTNYSAVPATEDCDSRIDPTNCDDGTAKNVPSPTSCKPYVTVSTTTPAGRHQRIPTTQPTKKNREEADPHFKFFQNLSAQMKQGIQYVAMMAVLSVSTTAIM